MMEHAENHLGGSHEIRRAIVQLATSAKELQNFLHQSDEVNCFVGCKSSSGLGMWSRRSELFTLVSRLFHKVLRSNELVITSRINRFVKFFHLQAFNKANKFKRSPMLPCITISYSNRSIQFANRVPI